MISKLSFLFFASLLLALPKVGLSQAPPLGVAASFVLFSTDGAVSNSGITHLTGNVGTNNGSSTAFGNVDGVMHDGGSTSAQCAVDLLIAYNQLDTTTPAFFPAPLLGNGQVLDAGVYSISSATTLNLDLTFDAQGDASAVFIVQIDGPLSTNALSEVKLANGALACNVFWKIEGLVDMATGTSMKGTVIANNAAINMNTGAKLEGRALSTTGAITVDGVTAYTPMGCGSPVLTGPTAPNLGAAQCYALFSANGEVSNTGISTISGDVGSNVGATIGYDSLTVTGTIHAIPDGSTALCASDLLIAYNYVNTLAYDIELLYPAQFGNSLVLTPHTYRMGGAATFTDTVHLNAQGNADAVFVIQINGSLSTSTYSNVHLMNGAQAKNVYWKVEGAVSINNYSTFRGTIICNNGALGAINTGVTLDGRALTTGGALTSAAINAVATTIPNNCSTVGELTLTQEDGRFDVYPNPFNESVNLHLNAASSMQATAFKLFNATGKEVMNVALNASVQTINTAELPSGFYFYTIMDGSSTVQTGKLIARH